MGKKSQWMGCGPRRSAKLRGRDQPYRSRLDLYGVACGAPFIQDYNWVVITISKSRSNSEFRLDQLYPFPRCSSTVSMYAKCSLQ